MSYIDPGTTSYFFQLLAATIAGGFLAFRHNIKSAFRKLFRADHKGTPGQDQRKTL